MIEQWRYHYNNHRPHSALGYQPPAPLTTTPKLTPVLPSPMMQQSISMQLVKNIRADHTSDAARVLIGSGNEPPFNKSLADRLDLLH